MVCEVRGGPRAKGRDVVMPPPRRRERIRSQEGKRRCREEMLGRGTDLKTEERERIRHREKRNNSERQKERGANQKTDCSPTLAWGGGQGHQGHSHRGG